MRYDYSISFVQGKLLYTADTLSRAPTQGQDQDDVEFTNDVSAYVESIINALPATDKRLQQIRSALQEDETCALIMHYSVNGWPEKHKLSTTLKAYWSFRCDLTVQQGLLLCGQRLVIPECLCKEILQKLHDGHQGITKTRAMACVPV